MPPLRLLVLATLGAGLLPAADEASGIALDAGWASTYMAHGFDVSKGACLQPSVSIDARLPGLRFAVWDSFALDQERRASDELNHLVIASRTWRPDTPWALTTRGYADYWAYPHSAAASATQNAQGIQYDHLSGWKFNAGFALPRLLSWEACTLIPSYDWFHWTPDVPGAFTPGSVNELALHADIPLQAALWAPQRLDLGVTADHHTGFLDVDPGWSVLALSAAATWSWHGLRLHPALNHQWCRNDSVNPRNRTWWATLSLGYAL